MCTKKGQGEKLQAPKALVEKLRIHYTELLVSRESPRPVRKQGLVIRVTEKTLAAYAFDQNIHVPLDEGQNLQQCAFANHTKHLHKRFEIIVRRRFQKAHFEEFLDNAVLF